MNRLFLIFIVVFLSCNNTGPTIPPKPDTTKVDTVKIKKDTILSMGFVNDPNLNGRIVFDSSKIVPITATAFKIMIDTSWIPNLRKELYAKNVQDTSWKQIQRDMAAELAELKAKVNSIPITTMVDDTSWRQTQRDLVAQYANINLQILALNNKINTLPPVSGIDTSWKPIQRTLLVQVEAINNNVNTLQNKVKLIPIVVDDTTWKNPVREHEKKLQRIQINEDSIGFRNGIELVVDPITKKKFVQLKKN